jgi:hypothetical protein
LSFAVLALSLAAVGASLIGCTVMFTVAALLLTAPSFVVKVNESEPL